jgi:DNA modification methylase
MPNKQKQEAAAVWMPIGDLTPWADNPRDNAAAIPEVAKSITRFGFASPIIARPIEGGGFEIIAGHTRHQAALSLGLDRVPVRVMDLDPTDAKLLALADNKVGEIATWSDGLGDLLKSLEADGIDLDGLGFDDDELAELLAPLPIEPDGSEDEVPDLQEEVHSKPGEVYELGPHRLACGDCRDPDVMATLMGGEQIGIGFTSPPYASQRVYDESSGFKPIKPDAYVEWFDAVQANVSAHLSADGSWFVNIKEHCDDGQRSLYVKDLTIAHVRTWDWMFVDELAWLRNTMPGGFTTRFRNGWEPVFHFSKHKTIRFRHQNVSEKSDLIKGKLKESKTGSGFHAGTVIAKSGLARPDNVITVHQSAQGIPHPAQYPVGLPVFFVKAYTDHDCIVFDPFMGSGTTLIAAAQEGRRGYGCEISPGYCDVIRRRWTTWAKQHDQEPGPGALE